MLKIHFVFFLLFAASANFSLAFAGERTRTKDVGYLMEKFLAARNNLDFEKAAVYLSENYKQNFMDEHGEDFVSWAGKSEMCYLSSKLKDTRTVEPDKIKIVAMTIVEDCGVISECSETYYWAREQEAWKIVDVKLKWLKSWNYPYRNCPYKKQE